MPGKFNVDEMRAYLATLTNDRQLEHRLDIVRAQISLAHEKMNTTVLEELQAHERLIIERRLELNYSNLAGLPEPQDVTPL